MQGRTNLNILGASDNCLGTPDERKDKSQRQTSNPNTTKNLRKYENIIQHFLHKDKAERNSHKGFFITTEH
jgi:hypothetical protein